MKILITGGWGSIGTQIVDHFKEHDLVVLDSFRHKGYRDRMDLIDRDIKTIQTDLTCPINDEMIKEIGDVDHIIHLAAMSDVWHSVENPVYTIQNNVNSTLTMLEYARKVKPKSFIYFSTDEVYGPADKENGELKGHKEWETHRPSNAYAASKAACEDICYSYWRSYDVPLIITNTMNNFGFAQSASKFPVIVQNKIEAGEKVTIHGNDKEIGTRYYIDSRDVADALELIIGLGVHHHKVGETDNPHKYHIVGEKALSNLELAEVIAELMGKPLKYELYDIHKDNPAHDIHYGLENNKLNWKPQPLEKRLKEVIDWQTENKEWI